MRVLVVSGAYPPHRSGEATNTYHLCRQLAGRGLDLHVLTTVNNSEPCDGITLHPVMQDWSWDELPRFVKVVKQVSPDAVLLMYIGWIYYHHPMITFSPSIVKLLLPGVAFVTRFENISGTVATTYISRVFRKIFALASDHADYEYGTLFSSSDRLIFLSGNHHAALSHRSECVDGKAVLIPPAPNMILNLNDREGIRKHGRERLNLSEKCFLISYIGFIYPAKGLESLLHAFKQVCDSSPDFRLVLIGGAIAEESGCRPTYMKTLEELTDKIAISDKVLWTGGYTWDDHKVSEYLLASDVCVLPFDVGVQLNNSSLSCVAIHGLPIITTQGPVVEKPFVHGENVFLCPPKSPQSIADAIMIVKEDDELRKRLKIGSLKLAQDWFSWEEVLDKTANALKSSLYI